MLKTEYFKFICIVLVNGWLLTSQHVCFGQTYLTPQLGVSYNTVTNNAVQFKSFPILKNDREESFSLGLKLTHHISDKFGFEVSSKLERLAITPTAIEVFRFVNGDYEVVLDFPLRRFIHRRFHYSLGFHIDIFDKLQIFASSVLIHTPSIKRQIRPEDSHIVSNWTFPAKEKELGLEMGFNYQVKQLSFSVHYRHGFWHNDRGTNGEIDPVKSVGIRVGYRFKVLDKPTRKNKVACPKF